MITKAIALLLISFFSSLNSGKKNIDISITLINEKGVILKDGSVNEYSNNIYVGYSKPLNQYYFKTKHDTLSFYITHPGYEPIKFKTILTNCTDTVFYEFKMKKKNKAYLGD
ncbi:MAG TPA: hypothetical protein PK328_00500 [Chitinophagaceae bacterium]|nr:hypothetical protein [Chitinophagaceae bacterium]